MIVFRQNPIGLPFLWESSSQPAGRWNRENDGPTQYLSDTPDGAWAEFLRHQDIRDSSDLTGIQRDLWAIEIPDSEDFKRPALPDEICKGDLTTYEQCQDEAKRMRSEGVTAIETLSAALKPGEACGSKVDGGLRPASARNGTTYVLFGRRPDLRAWIAAKQCRPAKEVLPKVRYFRTDRLQKFAGPAEPG